MAISTYTELKTAIADYIGRGDITSASSVVADWIVLFEADANRKLKIREMETAADLTTNAQSIALPTGYGGLRRLYISGDPNRGLKFLAPQNFWSLYLSAQTSKPQAFTVEGDNIVFGPAPDTTYAGKLLYYARFGPLSGGLNDVFANHPDLYLFGSLLQAVPYMGFRPDDQRPATWLAAYQVILQSIEESDVEDRFSGPLQMVADVGNP